jgi:hypothetical protein
MSPENPRSYTKCCNQEVCIVESKLHTKYRWVFLSTNETVVDPSAVPEPSFNLPPARAIFAVLGTMLNPFFGPKFDGPAFFFPDVKTAPVVSITWG